MMKKLSNLTFIVALAFTLSLLISLPSAYANRPLNVDCDLLAATNDDVDAFLDANNIEFDNLGDAIASSILDDDLFNDLNALITLFSGGAISFDSATQLVATTGKCGLIQQLVDNIRD